MKIFRKYWIAIVILIAVLLLGYRVDWQKTVKLLLEKRLGIVVKDSNSPVFLSQEYPAVEGISYRDSINLAMYPALMIFQENEQPFWLGIENVQNDKNYNNPTLFLNFNGKVNVRVDPQGSSGWVEMDPNFSYFIKFNNAIQPRTGIRIPPLFVKFPKERIYSVRYTISGDNEVSTEGNFSINVHKKIIVKNIERQER